MNKEIARNKVYHNLNTSNGTMGIHTFAQHHKNDLQSLQFFIPQSLKALQQHNSRSPNLVYKGRGSLQYIANWVEFQERGAHHLEREGAPHVRERDKCESYGLPPLISTPRSRHV
jgi:hypothetical protein